MTIGDIPYVARAWFFKEIGGKMAGSNSSIKWRIELFYWYKQAKLSRITVLNMQKLYIYFFSLNYMFTLNCMLTLFTLNCMFTLFTLNYIFTLFTLNYMFTLFTLNYMFTLFTLNYMFTLGGAHKFVWRMKRVQHLGSRLLQVIIHFKK